MSRTLTQRPVRQAVPPTPGRGPRMILDGSGAARPLLAEDIHGSFCGFVTSKAHPLDRRVAQCFGCRCWVVRRDQAVTR